ncbi:hypothetical protein MMC16_003868 [Acarospora aff. strigata]|nr:hypothetical protein [Acarospora aff. strigata]
MKAKIAADPVIGNFAWIVQSYSFDLATSNVFYFGVTADPYFTSHYFNITNSVVTSSTSSAATLNITSSSLTASSTVPTSPTVATSTYAAASPPKPSEIATSGLQVGLGVGLGIGIPIILLLGALVALRVLQQRKADAQQRQQQPSEWYQSRDDQDLQRKTSHGELMGSDAVIELPVTERRDLEPPSVLL